MTALTHRTPNGLLPQSLKEAAEFAAQLAKSSFIPKEFMGRPDNILAAIQWGMELGLPPLQAIHSIAVINGRPALRSDAVMALVRASPLCEYIDETIDEKGTALCRVKRRGQPEQVRSFSDQDAHQAGLTGRPGPWTQHPQRMKQMRARTFALRDVFPDVLLGMVAEEEGMGCHEEANNTISATLEECASSDPLHDIPPAYPESWNPA
ncbi:hypothetical protein BGZ92_000005 [Podila epicladia]|nr:hypothetical protein BGZ92_000005 [Podila epicladia]